MSIRSGMMPALAFLLACAACDPGRSNPAPTTDPRCDGAFTLYRLDGDRYPGDPVPEGAVLLHGWPILEACPIESMTTRESLFKALDKGIAERGDIPIDCFNPRHAIRVETDGGTVDYLICFQCQNYETWKDDNQSGGGLMSASPEATFERVLEECRDDDRQTIHG